MNRTPARAYAWLAFLAAGSAWLTVFALLTLGRLLDEGVSPITVASLVAIAALGMSLATGWGAFKDKHG